MKTPAALQQQLQEAMKQAGIPVPDSEERWQQALTALKVTPAQPSSGQHLPAMLSDPDTFASCGNLKLVAVFTNGIIVA